MPSESKPGREPRHEEVLTLAEAAMHLRVQEKELADLADRNGVPARKVGGEWRFLKKALDDWLRYPGPLYHEGWMAHPRWLMESPFAEELVYLLEQRLLQKLKQAAPQLPRPGSKEAVLKYFGVFKDEDDLEERLAAARKLREASG
jgi:excisionase family DNA binding protein